MTSTRRIERRQAKHARLTLEHSFLFRIPLRLACAAVIPILGILRFAEVHASHDIWFGPAYLAVIALAAWSISSRVAIATGLVVLSVKLASGDLPFYADGSQQALPNIALRVVAIAIVVGFIGMARKSCEREWRSARTDPLTGALNRQAFFEIVETGQCHGGWSAIIYADLDGLKKVNDKAGHGQGDRSLRAFAETVRETIRAGDVFARMGGDEFVIFMKLKNEQAGAAVAGRLHKALNYAASDDGVRLTCSLGVLLLPDGCKAIDGELRAADQLMYEAKKSRSGVLVSTAIECDGEVFLSPALPVLDPAERETAVRQRDRECARLSESPPVAA
ncbi:MAG TPA: GGDEF domain-containing protein [Novosphingobium sp.]|nr:GGDEF domain-containing protein [Novosphingobium sp.]